jgi:hypothetical protein
LVLEQQTIDSFCSDLHRPWTGCLPYRMSSSAAGQSDTFLHTPSVPSLDVHGASVNSRQSMYNVWYTRYFTSLQYHPQFKYFTWTIRAAHKFTASLHSETTMTHFLLNLLRIKVLYVFRALVAHLQEALQIRPLVYCVRVMSVGFTGIGVDLVFPTPVPLQSWCSQLT